MGATDKSNQCLEETKLETDIFDIHISKDEFLKFLKENDVTFSSIYEESLTRLLRALKKTQNVIALIETPFQC